MSGKRSKSALNTRTILPYAFGSSTPRSLSYLQYVMPHQDCIYDAKPRRCSTEQVLEQCLSLSHSKRYAGGCPYGCSGRHDKMNTFVIQSIQSIDSSIDSEESPTRDLQPVIIEEGYSGVGGESEAQPISPVSPQRAEVKIRLALSNDSQEVEESFAQSMVTVPEDAVSRRIIGSRETSSEIGSKTGSNTSTGTCSERSEKNESQSQEASSGDSRATHTILKHSPIGP